MPVTRSRHQTGFKFLLAGFTVLIALGAAELGLRLMGVQSGGKTERGDPEMGYAPRPNARTPVRFFEYANGFIPMQTNNLGLVEETPTDTVKPPGVVRIGFVGDSQTQGACADSESYPNQLEAILNTGAARYEVLNGGVSRYSPYQYLLRAERVLRPLDCDQLVVGLYLGNDLQDIVRRDDRPYASIASDGTLEYHPPEWVTIEDPRESASLLARSRVGSMFNRKVYRPLRFRVIQARSAYTNMPPHHRSVRAAWNYLHELKTLNEIGHGIMAQCVYQLVYFEFFPDSEPEALRLNQALMASFAAECARQGCALTYVLIPSKMSVEPEDAAEMMANITREDPRLTLDRVQDIENRFRTAMLEEAARRGVNVIDLQPELIRRREGRRLYYAWDMHLNATGNRVVAEILDERLRATARIAAAASPGA